MLILGIDGCWCLWSICWSRELNLYWSAFTWAFILNFRLLPRFLSMTNSLIQRRLRASCTTFSVHLFAFQPVCKNFFSSFFLRLLPQFLLRPQPPSHHLHHPHHPRHLCHHCRLTYLPIYLSTLFHWISSRSPPSFSSISTKFLAFSIKFLLFQNYYFEKYQDKDSISRTFLEQFVLVLTQLFNINMFDTNHW